MSFKDFKFHPKVNAGIAACAAEEENLFLQED